VILQGVDNFKLQDKDRNKSGQVKVKAENGDGREHGKVQVEGEKMDQKRDDQN
jgi:hypothetical protein